MANAEIDGSNPLNAGLLGLRATGRIGSPITSREGERQSPCQERRYGKEAGGRN